MNKYVDKNKFFKFLGLFVTNEFITVILSMYFLKFFCKYALNNYYDDILSDNPLIFSFISSLFCAAILICIYSDYLKEKWNDFKTNFKNYAGISIKNWLIGISIMIISNLIISTLTGLGTAENEEAVQKLIMSNKFYALLLTSILAPFVEELIYRKSIFDVIKVKKYFPIISGLVFGLMHVLGSETILDYLYIIPYGALGYYFAKTYAECNNNVYSSMLSHFIHNFICTIISF